MENNKEVLIMDIPVKVTKKPTGGLSVALDDVRNALEDATWIALYDGSGTLIGYGHSVCNFTCKEKQNRCPACGKEMII